MNLIKISQLIKTVNSEQYLEIFSVNRKTLDIETGLYRVNEIPSKLMNLYVAYVASGTKDSLQVRTNDDIKSVLLIDAYDTIQEATKVMCQIQDSCKTDADVIE